MAIHPPDHQQEIWKQLENRLNLAHAYHDVWSAICGKGLLPQHAAELNEHVVLVSTIEAGMEKAFVVELCSLYDSDDRSVTFAAYAKILRNCNRVPANWENDFKESTDLAKRLQFLRNKHFAHDSMEKFTQNIWGNVGMTYNLLTELLERSEALMTMLMKADDGSVYRYWLDPKPDIAGIFPDYDPSEPWIETTTQKRDRERSPKVGR